MEYPIFYIHVELYIIGKLGYISQLLTRFYFNLSCTKRVIFFRLLLPIIKCDVTKNSTVISPPTLTGTKHHEQLSVLPELPDVIP